MIAVHCENYGHNCGMLVHIEPFGIVSDATWKCSDTATPGWTDPSFDDSGWSQAVAIAPNNGNGRPACNQITSSAIWIWYKDLNAPKAYCRFNMGTVYFLTLIVYTEICVHVYLNIIAT